MKVYILRKLQLGDSHVLYEYCVNADPSKLIEEFLRVLQLVVIDYSVDRDIYFAAKFVSIFT